MKVDIFVILMALYFLNKSANSGASKQASIPDPCSGKNQSFLQKIKQFSSALNYFSIKFYQEMAFSTDTNLFVSPFSVATILSMINLGANGITAEQIEETLNIDFIDDMILPAFHYYLTCLLSENNNFTLKLVNRIYADSEITISEKYKNQLIKYYQTEIESVDFLDRTEHTRKKINHWIAKYTNNTIKDPLPKYSLLPTTLLLLLNAIYFKGSWEKKFQKKNTYGSNFYLLDFDRYIWHDFMYVQNIFPLKTNDRYDYQVLELPYVGQRLSMLVVLPRYQNGLIFLEHKMNSVFLKELLQEEGFRNTKVSVHLPKFKLKNSLNLKTVLMDMGITEIFYADISDLKRMAPDEDFVSVDKFIHKTYLEVNEEGTLASAASEIQIISRSASQAIFKANHPFMFLITDREFELVLFIGRVLFPNSTN